MSRVNNKDELPPEKMRPLQKLYPEAIYSFHRVFHEIWSKYGYRGPEEEKIVAIAASLFSKHTRTFHWLAVSDWGIKSDICDGIKKNSYTENWGAFKENLNTGHMPIGTKRAIKVISKILEGHATNDEIASAPRHLYSLYEGYHHDPRLYLDGIVYRNLKELHQSSNSRGAKIDYYYGTFLRNEEGTFAIYPWMNVKFINIVNNCISKLNIKSVQCQELDKPGIDNISEIPILNPEEKTNFNHRPGWGIAFLLLQEIFFKDTIKKIVECKESYVLVIPLYDVWIGKEAWGSLCGNLLLFFEDKSSLDGFGMPTFKDELSLDGKSGLNSDIYLDRFRDKSQLLIQELTKSGTQMLLKEPIKPPYDLVDHFVKNLKILQDWERIIVYRGKEPQYSYHWWLNPEKEKENDSEWKQYEWKLCDCVNNTSGNASCGHCPSWEKVEKDKEYLRWEHDFWDSSFLSDISDEEKSTFSGIRLAFEYPITACIPENETKRTALGEEYIRQQLEVLRGLMPKVRARRAALRSAVSAIMGRNMSHNIGSHVLARYSSAIKHDLKPACKEKTDHRTDFLGYLQRRMDFLAEVATADKALWAQPLSLKDSLSRLNYETQEERFATSINCEQGRSPNDECSICKRLLKPSEEKKVEEDKCNKPILLSYITGKESLKASVEFGVPVWKVNNYTIETPSSQDDSWFSCPGGEVGVHALYVILENIIRNSARHATSDTKDEDKFVRLFVTAERGKESEELIKLTIIDLRTKLDESGNIPKSNGQQANEDAKAELCDFDIDGKRIKKESLTDEINSILQCEPFLNSDGSTNTHYWGVREMQICAHYLRGLQLSDLEGMHPSPDVIKAKVYPDPSAIECDVPGYCLSYEIHLQPTKLLAVVNYPDTFNGELDKKGIKFIQSIENGTAREEEQAWQSLVKQSEGFSFVVLPEHCIAPPDKIRILPARTIKLDADKLEKILKVAEGDKTLAWMEPLHEAIIHRYREIDKQDTKKHKRWGNGDIHVVIAYEEKDISNDPLRCGSITLHHRSSGGDAQSSPFSSLPDSLSFNEDSHGYLGLAWVDHPTEPALCNKDGATPGSAAFFVNESLNWASVEAMFGDSPHTQQIRALRDPKTASGAAELAAAALARVVVLDERIQSKRRDSVRGVRLFKYWPLAGIWCPFHPKDSEVATWEPNAFDVASDMYHSKDVCCDLDSPDFDAIKKFLISPSKLDYQLPADYLVIHLTILENLHKHKGNLKLSDTLNELVKGTACEGAEIVIVTGRGVPTAAHNHVGSDYVDARYLPISALLEYLVTRPSKLALMRVLWSAAVPRRNSVDVTRG
jgi:hypothetical protein